MTDHAVNQSADAEPCKPQFRCPGQHHPPANVERTSKYRGGRPVYLVECVACGGQLETLRSTQMPIHYPPHHDYKWLERESAAGDE